AFNATMNVYADFMNNGTTVNSGVINNEFLITNNGILINDCTGQIIGTGSLAGNAILDLCPPTVDDQELETDEDTELLITLTGADNQSSITFIVVTQPQNGNLTGTNATWTYTPNLHFFGNDTFTFVATDGVNN